MNASRSEFAKRATQFARKTVPDRPGDGRPADKSTTSRKSMGDVPAVGRPAEKSTTVRKRMSFPPPRQVKIPLPRNSSFQELAQKSINAKPADSGNDDDKAVFPKPTPGRHSASENLTPNSDLLVMDGDQRESFASNMKGLVQPSESTSSMDIPSATSNISHEDHPNNVLLDSTVARTPSPPRLELNESIAPTEVRRILQQTPAPARETTTNVHSVPKPQPIWPRLKDTTEMENQPMNGRSPIPLDGLPTSPMLQLSPVSNRIAADEWKRRARISEYTVAQVREELNVAERTYQMVLRQCMVENKTAVTKFEKLLGDARVEADALRGHVDAAQADARLARLEARSRRVLLNVLLVLILGLFAAACSLWTGIAIRLS